MCNNLNLDLVNINIQNLVKFYEFLLKMLSGNEIMTDWQNDGHNDEQPKSFFKMGLKIQYSPTHIFQRGL